MGLEKEVTEIALTAASLAAIVTAARQVKEKLILRKEKNSGKTENKQ